MLIKSNIWYGTALNISTHITGGSVVGYTFNTLSVILASINSVDKKRDINSGWPKLFFGIELAISSIHGFLTGDPKKLIDSLAVGIFSGCQVGMKVQDAGGVKQLINGVKKDLSSLGYTICSNAKQTALMLALVSVPTIAEGHTEDIATDLKARIQDCTTTHYTNSSIQLTAWDHISSLRLAFLESSQSQALVPLVQSTNQLTNQPNKWHSHKQTSCWASHFNFS